MPPNPPTALSTVLRSHHFSTRRWLEICLGLLLVMVGLPVLAGNLLYVSLDNSSIVTFDATGSDGAAIAATRTLFATTSGVPYGLVLDNSGNLYAAIAYANTINRYDATGTLQGTITSHLSGPNGLALDRSGNLYTANYANHTISKFDPAGSFLATIGGPDHLSQPYGLAFDTSGYLYVSNGLLTTSFISAFDPSGAYSADRSIGSDHLDGPIGLVFDTAGNLHVANYNASTLATFNARKEFQGTITGNLTAPYGLTRDAEGFLYAINLGSNSISKFDASGVFVTTWLAGGAPIWGAFQPVAVPEIDPGSYGSALGLLLGSLSLVDRRRRSGVGA